MHRLEHVSDNAGSIEYRLPIVLILVESSIQTVPTSASSPNLQNLTTASLHPRYHHLLLRRAQRRGPHRAYLHRWRLHCWFLTKGNHLRLLVLSTTADPNQTTIIERGQSWTTLSAGSRSRFYASCLHNGLALTLRYASCSRVRHPSDPVTRCGGLPAHGGPFPSNTSLL